MTQITVQELIRRSKLRTEADVVRFHELRQAAVAIAEQVYADRAESYNVDHPPTEEMPYGAVSLASEIFKRAIRMTGLLTPLREYSLRPEDIKRILDTCTDLINYAAWQYALVTIAVSDVPGAGHVHVTVSDGR